MKTIIWLVFIMMLSVNLSFSQAPADCPSTSTLITECGITYTGNNDGFTDNCGTTSLCGCVGGNSNSSNIDNNCATVYSGGNCGSDFAGSIENSMWWKFTPVEDCDYVISVTAYNCCCAQGNNPDFMQVWIGQMNNGAVTSYLINDGSNTSISNGNTIIYTVPVSVSNGDVMIMLDGFAGSECDVDISIQPSTNCTNTCPIILSNGLEMFKGERDGSTVSISYQFNEYTIDNYTIQKSHDALNFEDLHSISGYSGTVNDDDAETVYYRVIYDMEIVSNVIAVRGLDSYNQSKILYSINALGVEINPEYYNGWYIEVHSDGTKKIKKNGSW